MKVKLTSGKHNSLEAQQVVIDKVINDVAAANSTLATLDATALQGETSIQMTFKGVDSTQALWESAEPSPPQQDDLDANDKKRLWPAFFAIARNLERAVVNFGGGTSKTPLPNKIEDANPKLEDATGISSKVHPKHNMPGLHKIVLDIDHNAVLIPSSSPSHYHLIVDHYVNWEDYQELLRAMAKCNLIEKGYMEGSIKSGASWLRTPWTKKNIRYELPATIVGTGVSGNGLTYVVTDNLPPGTIVPESNVSGKWNTTISPPNMDTATLQQQPSIEEIETIKAQLKELMTKEGEI